MLLLQVTRTSPTNHKLSYKRENGSGETAELETKSFLIHDFTHYCVESEAGLSDGFFGLLAKGYSYGQLSGKTEGAVDVKVAADVEQVVAVLNGVVKGRVSISDAYTGLKGMYAAHGKRVPDWVNEELLNRVIERYRRLLGEWNSLQFGETLTLRF